MECKVESLAAILEQRDRLIGNIVECKDIPKSYKPGKEERINRKHSGM